MPLAQSALCLFTVTSTCKVIILEKVISLRNDKYVAELFSCPKDRKELMTS